MRILSPARLVPAITLALAGVFLVSGPAVARSGDTCSGVLGSGTYRNLTVNGFCELQGTVRVNGTLTLSPGSTLMAFQPNVTVNGGIRVGAGAFLGLGCSAAMAEDPFISFLCPDGASKVTINGDVVADSPLTMDLDGIVVNGDVVSTGGGGPETQTNPFAFNYAFKDNIVNGDVSLTGWDGGWMGMIRNQVSGDVTYSSNVGVDPDTNEIVHNTVGGDLSCWDNVVPAQFGDASGGNLAYAVNVVGGQATGECAALV